MNVQQYTNFLLTHLPNAKLVSGGREVNCKCMYCDDKHAHMYIKIPQNPNEASFYNCFRCPAQGIVTPNTLNDWNCYNDEIAVSLINHNKNIKFAPVDGKRDVRMLRWGFIADNEEARLKAMAKADYINNRLGLALTIQDMLQLKICFNLTDILRGNKTITSTTRSATDIELLDKYVVGFLSVDNSFINFRRIVPEGIINTGLDKRYINYNIFNKFDNTERFYVIPTELNLMSRERIKLHIAEGPLDCLSIYLNCRNREPGVYAAIAGNNYQGIVRHMIIVLQTNFLEVNIYPDNDNSGDDRKMNNIIELCRPLNIPVIIHRNTYSGEKDFGVPKDRINETIYNI